MEHARVLNLNGGFRLDNWHLQTLGIAMICSESNAKRSLGQSTDGWPGGLADLGAAHSAPRRDLVQLQETRDGALNGATCPPASHAQWLNSCFSDSLLLLLLLFSSSGPWEFNLAPGEPAVPLQLLFFLSWARIRNFTIYPLSVSCSESHFVYFGRALVEGWLDGWYLMAVIFPLVTLA